MKLLTQVAFATIAVLVTGTSTNAQLLGNDLRVEWWYPSFGAVLESHIVTVTDGIELPASTIINDSKFDIDIADNTVQFSFNNASNWTFTGFNGWYFSDVNGTIGDISGYTVDAVSGGVAGVSDADLAWDADSFWGNFAGVTVAGGGDFIRLAVDAGGLNLSLSGSCPGPITASVSGATPGGTVAFAYATGPGSLIIPGGTCAGTQLGLNATAMLVGTVSADGSGNASITGNAPPVACGGVVQAVDASTCTTSNVESL